MPYLAFGEDGSNQNKSKKGRQRMRNTSIGKIAGAMAAVAILATLQAKADFTANLTQDYSSTGFGEPAGFVFGTVNVAQGNNSQTVNVTVNLTSGFTFAGSGAGFALGFNLSGGTGVATIGNVAFTPASSFAIEYAPPALHADGTGNWQYAVDYKGAGTSGTPPTTLTFTVTANSGTLSPSDFVPQTSGDHLLFVSDIGGNGFTGDVAAVPEPTTMIAGVLLLLPFGVSTLRILRKNRA